MRKVYKYLLKCGDGAVTTLELPPLYQLLHVAKQGDCMMLWAVVAMKPLTVEKVKILCVGTGHSEVPRYAAYISTLMDGADVWHYFKLS